jgi:hypothetical protein
VCLDFGGLAEGETSVEARYARAVVGSLVGAQAASRAAPLQVSVRGLANPAGSSETPVPADAPLVGFDLVHRFGAPRSAADLERLLGCEAALVFTPLTLAALATPAVGADWARIEAERSSVWALAQAAGQLLVPEPEMLRWLSSWLERGREVGLVLPLSPKVHVPAQGEVEAFRELHGLSRPYVLHLGGDAPWNNLPWVLEAWRLASGNRELVLAGPACRLPLSAFARPASWPPAVRRLESLTPVDVARLVAGADALVHVPTVPGIELDVRLAVALGVPVVSPALSTPEHLAAALSAAGTQRPLPAAHPTPEASRTAWAASRSTLRRSASRVGAEVAGAHHDAGPPLTGFGRTIEGSALVDCYAAEVSRAVDRLGRRRLMELLRFARRA